MRDAQATREGTRRGGVPPHSNLRLRHHGVSREGGKEELSIKKLYRTKVEETFPEKIKITLGDREIEYYKAQSLRYGENPHQPAAYYAPKEGKLTVGAMKILKTGKGGLSRTNIEDMNNAMNIVRYFDDASCAIMKHVNPAGVAVARKGDSLKTVLSIFMAPTVSLPSFGA